MVGQETSLEDQDRLRQELGLNDSVIVQYGRFLSDLVVGDFGFSYRTRQPIGEMILQRLPATMELGQITDLRGGLRGFLKVSQPRKGLRYCLIEGSRSEGQVVLLNAILALFGPNTYPWRNEILIFADR